MSFMFRFLSNNFFFFFFSVFLHYISSWNFENILSDASFPSGARDQRGTFFSSIIIFESSLEFFFRGKLSAIFALKIRKLLKNLKILKIGDVATCSWQLA